MATVSICSIPDCGKPVIAKGFCGKHYQRMNKYGDPLYTAVTPKGDVGVFFHEIVIPYEGKECLFWPYARDSNGYPNLYHNGKVTGAHRIAASEALELN